ncbi:MAG: hypothetical protein HY906_11090, partial [Deltaproteobacteria bacterium]|nr:hypothetical protein [Deltaproteobacteria bacterium]
MARTCLFVVALVGCGLACTPTGVGRGADGTGDGVGVQRRAVGEPLNGFPNWDERAIHLWINRGRADPQSDLTENCQPGEVPEQHCYTPQHPLLWSYELNRAARFHSANQTSCGHMTHDSSCTLVSNIGDEATGYTPGPCDGDKACACQSGSAACSCTGACTGTWTRIGKFGGSGNGECVASGGPGDPLGEYYMWVCEAFNQDVCAYVPGPPTNGHRWNILMGGGPAVGPGCAGNYCTLDFGGPAAAANKIIVAVHYPESGSTVALRAHWYDPAGAPNQAMVNVDGACQAMTKERGVDDNNATYLFDNLAVGSGCAHYYFVFKDQADTFVTYPESGSYGVNCGADYDQATRPSMDASCSCTPACGGKPCGPDGCGGNCPPGCAANAPCSGNACSCTILTCGTACCAAGQVCYQDACCTKNCNGKQCGTDGCGGTCGTCAGSLACDANGACGCTGGLTACGTACVNTQSDVANCGGCNRPRASPQVCAAGTCSDSCQAGYENCSGSCADLQRDPTHCGRCDVTCSPGASCEAGQCVCPGGLLDCPGAGCTDVQTDPSNCGECGRECFGCQDGHCPGDGEDAGTGGHGDGLQGSCGCAAGDGGGFLLAVLLLAALALARRRERRCGIASGGGGECGVEAGRGGRAHG